MAELRQAGIGCVGHGTLLEIESFCFFFQKEALLF
jgi:hypothetical protein